MAPSAIDAEEIATAAVSAMPVTRDNVSDPKACFT